MKNFYIGRLNEGDVYRLSKRSCIVWIKYEYQKCMENISVDEVFNTITDVLMKRDGQV